MRKGWFVATSILLVTQDCYLVRGMKIFFPDIVQLSSEARDIFGNDADEYSILIDSRSPLRCYDYLIRDAAKTRKPVCCVMLDMQQREPQQLDLSLFLNISLTPKDMAALFNLFLNAKSKHLNLVWLKNLQLTSHEQTMLRLLKAGMAVDEIARQLHTSIKGLYREREILYKRLGVANFNEACLFIFKNKLLEYAGSDPWQENIKR